jgi:PAS domain S-box-containing protein
MDSYSSKARNFLNKIEKIQEEVASMKNGVSSSETASVGQEALEEMSIMIEEMEVAEEEILKQNEELSQVRDALEAERHRYQDLFEFAPDGYLVTDMSGIIQEANRAAAALFNVPDFSLKGKPLSLYIDSSHLKIFRTGMLNLEKASPEVLERTWEWELRIKPRKKASVPVSVRMTPILPSNEQSGAKPQDQSQLRWLFRDISSQVEKQADLERRSVQIQLLQQLAFAANQAADLQEALQYAVDRLCEYSGWPVGHAFLRRDQPRTELVATNIWHLEEPEKYAQFKQVTETLRLAPGDGLSGRVLENGQALWIEDVTQEADFKRLSIPEDRNVRTGLFFPILVGDEVGGVLEFFLEWVSQPEEDLIEIMGHVGVLLGRVLERHQARQALLESERKLRTVISGAPLVLWATDQEGRITFMEGKGYSDLEYNPKDLIGQSLWELVDDQPDVADYVRRALGGEEVYAIVKSQTGLFFDARYTPLRDVDGKIIGMINVSNNITERVRTEQALRESELRFRTIFQQAHMGIDLVDIEGNIVESNPALREMLGYTAEEMRHMNYTDFTHLDDISSSQAFFKQLIEGERDHFQFDKRYIRKNGKTLWARLSASVFRDERNQPKYAIALIEDISIQKQLENEVAEVERRLLARGEEERILLARELHDGPLQDLHAIAFHLAPIKDSIEQPEIITELGGIQSALSKVIQSLRTTCGELRPPALAPFGLEKAIRSHAGSLQEQYSSLKVGLDLDPDGKSIPEWVRLALFRIYQQAVLNVVRHAQAENLLIRFKVNSDEMILEIVDDGRGFELPEKAIDLLREGHFGLVGAAERANAIGGRMSISSRPGEGTRIRITVPQDRDISNESQDRLSILFLDENSPASQS